MNVVADASVIVKWYVPEPHSADAELLLLPNFTVHVPELAIPELGNILWKKQCQGEPSEPDIARILAAFAAAPVTFHSQVSLLSGAVTGALATGQTVYDWTYLALAISLSCPFVTADRKFYEALQLTGDAGTLVWIEDLEDLI